jgi:predicted phosphodiesterase
LADPDSFSFAIVGDTHIGADTTLLQNILTEAAGEGDSFFILLGDMVDKGVAADMARVKAAVQGSAFANKALYIVGNHDVFEDGWTGFKTAFGPSAFTLTLGNSQFIALDTADGTVGRDQYEWLQTQLTAGSPTNRFILSHYLPVVPGQRTYLRLADEGEAARLMKLATREGARAWLGGHYHSYGEQVIEGVQYVVAGGGGGRLMPPINGNFFVQVVVSGSSVTFHLKRI